MFQDFGIDDIYGIDGEYVDKKQLFIEEKYFYSADITQPISLPKNFDLVISLEVGEHIPHKSEDTYFENIVRHGQIIYFSAAIPFQGGTNHINEQWQEYWAQKFIKHGYEICDIVRHKFWNNSNIQTHYIQNGLVYVKKSIIDRYPNIKPYIVDFNSLISVVHPRVLTSKCDPEQQSVQLQFRIFLKVLFMRIKLRLYGKK